MDTNSNENNTNLVQRVGNLNLATDLSVTNAFNVGVERPSPTQQATTAVSAQIYGIVTKTEKKSKVDGVWGPSKFTIFAPKSGFTIQANCTHFCCVEPEDIIYCVGVYSVSEFGVRRIEISQTPNIEPGVSRTIIVSCFIKALYYSKDITRRLVAEKADELYDYLVKITGSMSEYEGIETADRVNQYLIKLANEINANGAAGKETVVKPLRCIMEIDDAFAILKYWYLKREIRKLHMLGLRDKDIKESPYSTDILYKKVRNNPYTVPIVSSEKCVELMMRFGKTATDRQIRCGEILRSIYSDNKLRYWAYTPYSAIKRRYPDFDDYSEELTADIDTDGETPYGYDIRVDTANGNKGVYLRTVMESEICVAEKFQECMLKPKFDFIDPKYILETLSEDQLTAINGVLKNRCSVLTGGGGTGKTTCIAEVIHNLDLRNTCYAICSFTGKAVARIREVLIDAKLSEQTIAGAVMTLHRAIYKGLPCDDLKVTHLIIDETSMVTTDLIAKFFDKFINLEWILMVGDCNQLLPITWGCFFNEVINSSRVPVFRLTKNHRTYKVDGESDLVSLNAEKIAMFPEDIIFEFETGPSFTLVEGDLNKVEMLTSLFHQSGIKDHQFTIITPRNKERNATNSIYQKLFRTTKSQAVVDTAKITWMPGDRVIMLENNYDINVMNGEEGRIISANAKFIEISFHRDALKLSDAELSEYKYATHRFSTNAKALDERWSSGILHTGMISHAYCLTTHKSQGSEWDFIFVYIPEDMKASKGFFNRNLLYTAITRGKRCVYIIGNTLAAQQAAVLKPHKRYESVCDRLKDLLPENYEGLDKRFLVIGIFDDEADIEGYNDFLADQDDDY